MAREAVEEAVVREDDGRSDITGYFWAFEHFKQVKAFFVRKAASICIFRSQPDLKV